MPIAAKRIRKLQISSLTVMTILIAIIFAAYLFGPFLLAKLSHTNDYWDCYVAATNFSSAAPRVTFINGSWIVPQIEPGILTVLYPFAWDSKQWIGIGGYASDPKIVQIGTETTYYGRNKSVSYYAWYEYFNENKITIGNFSLSPNDIVYASVTCTENCSAASQSWQIKLKDVTKNETFENASVFDATRTYGEWVVELIPLDLLSRFFVERTPTFFGQSYTGIDSDYVTINSITSPIGGSAIHTACSQSGIESVSGLQNETSFYVS